MTNLLAQVDKGTKVDFAGKLKENQIDLSRKDTKVLQVNVGKLCNQACHHCHVEAGPGKLRENMSLRTFKRLLELVAKSSISKVDITGGAPELNPNFCFFVGELRKMGVAVIDRCNLTVLFEKGQENTADFLADHEVAIVASLPCYSSANVEKQRGEGVFKKSIDALKLLNKKGYAKDPNKVLDLVYNPVGAHLPPDQATLEKEYKVKLFEDFGISFNQLFCITNMPIKRFLRDLQRQGRYEDYMALLLENFNINAAKNVMCLDLVSVSWDGFLFDCDFNQMLEMGVGRKKLSLWDIDSFQDLEGFDIAIADHCFGCTAGAGSSCSGNTVN